ncbi:MAG: hypothetical protein V4713_09720 [Pseudomonadota bacterium]
MKSAQVELDQLTRGECIMSSRRTALFIIQGTNLRLKAIALRPMGISVVSVSAVNAMAGTKK